jgi:CRISPR-associated RAMP protein (TIGR02581 family)
MVCWERFENHLEITAHLVAGTALRVGMGGEAAEPAAVDLPVIRDAYGRPFIPGSSLRGALRSHVERIVRALEPQGRRGKGACIPVDERNWCIRSGQRLSERYDPDREYPTVGIDDLRRAAGDDETFAQWVLQESCRVCRVFGSPWLASRVRIADLYPDGDVPTERRDGVAIHREKETVALKYDFEAIPVGARFRLTLLAENLSPTERGLLWLGLQELARGQILLGSFRGRGLGHVQLEGLEIRGVEATDRPALREYLLHGTLRTVPPEEADRWLEALVQEMMGGA